MRPRRKFRLLLKSSEPVARFASMTKHSQTVLLDLRCYHQSSNAGLNCEKPLGTWESIQMRLRIEWESFKTSRSTLSSRASCWPEREMLG